MILVIDNFDSFVHNLARYIGELGFERRTIRTDEITVREALALEPSAILLSPVPAAPMKRAYLSISSRLPSHIIFRSSVSVSAIRRLPLPLATAFSARRAPCMAKPLPFIIRVPIFLPTSLLPSQQGAIIP